MERARMSESRRSVMASSLTSSTGGCKRRVVLMRQPSREEEYEALKRYCHHKLLAPGWTSWTEGNPGKRFYGCRNYYKDGGYGFFAWHDGEFGERPNAVIKDLLNDIDKLYEENKKLRRGTDSAAIYEELVTIHGEVKKLKCTYEAREKEIRKWELKFRLAMATLLRSWVLMVVLCKY